jgi:cardiolipin synthase
VDLHELYTGAEWYAIPDGKRTKTQRLAARSLGVITPANGITLLGGIVTSIGLWAFWQGHGFLALGLITAGRLFDVLDGYVARHTHTSSPFGEGWDASMDKVVILLAAMTLIATQAVPWPLMLAIAALELITAMIVLLGRKLGVRVHPAKIGKYATFGLWSTLLLFVVAQAVGAETAWGRALHAVAIICGLGALGGALAALKHYVRAILHPERHVG